uniref:Si:ch211-67e16.11 n=1 Tax=Cynoglossus semilaevis TaxID=244447 RepID=A0A3P8UXW1_CYNSE
MVKSKLRGGYDVSQVLNRDGTHRHPQSFSGSVAHDAVLVLDPSPGENFGHPVFLFYVDVNVTKKRCLHMNGVYLDECLTLALKSRCQNQLKRWQVGWLPGGTLRGRSITVGRAGRLVERASGGLCVIHFLPLVVGVGDSNLTQKLRCVHGEFATCPQLLPMGSPSLPISSCELNKNTRRCHQQPLATHLSCRLYQTCDHAVLISGWRQQMTFQRHIHNLQRFYRMLRINGFHKDHIKTFFASGGQLPDLENVHPATEKAAIRNHVSYICRKQHCADTLVLYLNSPTRNDGTMLLWDADLKERYSVSELLTDLAGCRATRVLLFVDQSYSGVLSKRLRSSQKHLNVGLLNVTLAGAPCNVIPPLTDGELRKEYQGCQNLPTALWHQKQRQIS